jgi:hypothetical protein
MERWLRLEPFARAGFAARGIVYLALGYFALMSTHGEAAATVLERLRSVPFGGLLMVALAAGLFGYGLWRMIGGILDLDDEGRSLVGIVTRIGLVVSGLAHWVLCAAAILIAFSRPVSDQGEEIAAEAAFGYPGGATLVGIVGAIIIVSGVGQWLIGIRGGYMRFLNARQPRLARSVGLVGYGARGSVFIVIGWQVMSLAIGWRDWQQLGFDSALDVIARREWVFPAVAVGLKLFGVFSLMAALWLRIRDEDVERRAKLAGRWLRRD